VGELHQALASATDDPAFAPVPITLEDRHAWIEDVRTAAVLTLKRLDTQRGVLAPDARPSIDRVLAKRGVLLDRIETLDLAGLKAAKTRYHGDLHLGQVLLSGNDFVITDFEGEPARPLAERRRKHSPLRDVAGLLRSFNYAAAVAVARCIPEHGEEAAALAPRARDWEREVGTAFLAGYESVVIGRCVSYPDDARHARTLIDLFTLEKALYEVRYELDHRPDWIDIPVSGLLDFIDSHESTGERT
jgi:maltose alpha-D-glucosyltransferase/alpha-amylase